MTTGCRFSVALAAAVVLSACRVGSSPTVIVTQNGQTPGAAASSTVTAGGTATSTPGLAAPSTASPSVTAIPTLVTPSHTPQPTSPKPVGTTGAPKPTVAARIFTITPGSGSPQTTVTFRGTGCVGDGAGFALTFISPSGQEYTGDGGAARGDGTWDRTTQFTPNFSGGIPIYGTYRVRADCRGTKVLLFSYGTQSFDLTY